jgi:putative sterol carrier protein
MTHSSSYFRRVLEQIAAAEPEELRSCVKLLDGRLVYVVVETATDDEAFWIAPDSGDVRVTTEEGRSEPAVSIRITPAVISNILQGEFTPVEAFFMGKLRARGETRDLYAFLRFFIGVAQIGLAVPATLDLILEFEAEKL